MKTAGIIGLGLIGGSLAKALKRRSGFRIVAASRSEDSLKQALSDGAADEVELESSLDDKRLEELFSDCDVIFVCTPVNLIPGYLRRLSRIAKKSCILTDCGSTKGLICQEAASMGCAGFIGGHPMAGSEKTGYRHSIEHLFENAYYILTPPPAAAKEAVERLEDLARRIGAIPVIMDPLTHDSVVAAVSHGPHVIASALVNMVKSSDESGIMKALAAGGFKDITRIASSSPGMWQAISTENKAELLKFLSTFRKALEDFESSLSQSDEAYIGGFFSQAKEYRDSFISTVPSVYRKEFQIRVDVEDKPGSIAAIAAMLSANGINIKNIGVLSSREYEGGVLQISFDVEESMKLSSEILKRMNYLIYD
ncbi:MAG: prephenate dehydrogenase [Clostridiales bacterium]|jgi:prephenate dehydrogenase|nr:prephenate dehydrogenase [Clostridiales bacterium]